MSIQSTSILVLLKHRGQETDIEPVIGDGKVLWSGQKGVEWIGKGNEEWDSALLIKYDDTSEYQQAIERFRVKDFEQIRLFAVTPVSSSRRQILRFLMRNKFSRGSLDLSNAEFNWDNVPQREILPTKEQHARLAKEHKGRPIVMVNFIKYYDQPMYSPEYEGNRSRTGEEAYNRYGNYAMRTVARLGGVIEYMGKVEAILIGGQDEKWDQFAFMRYPSPDALQSMFRVREKPDAGVQRDAGLQTTRVFGFTPV